MVARRAFSLFEAVIASAILGVALTLVIGLTGDAIASQRRGERMEIASRLADEQLNMVLALGPEGFAAALPTSGRCDAPFQDYAYDVQITPGSGGQPYGVRAIITWAQGARTAQVSIQTLIAPRLGEESDPERAPEETLSRGTQQ